MNKFDERYEIRLAEKEDIDSIMQFINDHWKEGHIMSRSRELFEYEYVDGEDVNFVLAIDRSTHSIEGIFGFLRCSHTNEFDKRHIWGSIWKVNTERENMPLLGIELAKRVCPMTESSQQIGNGANPNTTVPLRKLFFKEKTVKMIQYYFLNHRMEQYHIAVIQDKWEPKIKTASANIRLQQFYTIEEVKAHFNIEKLDAIPYKDNWYLGKRYFQHPWYTYRVYGLAKESGRTEALMVTREIECKGSRILRIVDYMGNQKLFSELGSLFFEWTSQSEYEYIDFYVYGFDEQAVYDAGFRKRDTEDRNIIPNYFEPFLQENVDIWAHYKKEGTTFFKADGDQDRPNIISSRQG